MELNQLYYFQVVAKYQHMTRAAEELHISQSSLSKTIALLEKEIGVPLFDRIGRRIMLNSTGQQFLARIDRGLMEIDDAVREAAAEDHGTVSFATSNPPICATYMYQFIRSHPAINLRHFPMPFKRIREALDQGEIDFAISYDSLVSDTIAWDIIGQEEVLLLVSSAHPLAGSGSVPLEAMKHERFIFNNVDFGISEIGSTFCHQAGFEPNILFEGDLMKMSLQLVSDNLAVMFMSTYEYQWHTNLGHPDPSFEQITPLRISAPVCTRSIGLGYLKNRYLSPSARMFTQGLRQFFAGIDAAPDVAAL